MGILVEAIKEKLSQTFNPSQLEVIDESHKHAGHAGAAEHAQAFPDKAGKSAESHIHVVIVSDVFAGMNTLAKHRAVMDAVADEVAELHAFSLEARAQ